MSNFKKFNIRWNNPNSPDYENLGINQPDDDYIFKSVWIDMNKITVIEEFEGVICVFYSMRTEDCMITDIPYKDDIEYLKEKLGIE